VRQHVGDDDVLDGFVLQAERRLEGGPVHHGEVGIDPFCRIASEEFAHEAPGSRHAGGSPHQDHFVEVAGRDACSPQGRTARTQQSPQQRLPRVFDERLVEYEGHGPIEEAADRRHDHVGLLARGQATLGELASLQQQAQGRGVFDLGALVLDTDLVQCEAHEPPGEILAAEAALAGGAATVNVRSRTSWVALPSSPSPAPPSSWPQFVAARPVLFLVDERGAREDHGDRKRT